MILPSLSRELIPSSAWRYCSISDVRESLGSNRVTPPRFGDRHTDEEADSLDVAAVRDLIWTRPERPKGKSCDSASRLRIHTQKIIKNVSSGRERLSKIAHK